MKQPHHRLVPTGILALFTALSLLGFGGTAQAKHDLQSHRITFPVTLSDGNTYSVVGYLYSEGAHPENRPLQVLVHGATINHNYWDLPTVNDEDYSYVRYMAHRGYALLAIDQLGTGESSHPDGDFLTLDVLAQALHQVTAAMRSGHNALGATFHHVVAVGHSMGSSTIVYTQGTYRDFDAIVTTGMGHVPHDIPVSPDVITRALAGPYFHFTAAENQGLSFAAPYSDPALVQSILATYDEPLSRGEFFTVLAGSFDPNATRVNLVQGDVLVLMGEQDVEFPATFASGEAATYTSTTHVSVRTIHHTGHSVNAHDGRYQAWRLINTWLALRLYWPEGERDADDGDDD